MRPERMADLVARWVRFYTRDLPAPVARRRIDEIKGDLHDHVAHERAAGAGERRIALAIASRMLRGVPADLAWRGEAKPTTRRSSQEERMKTKAARRSAVRVATGVALVLALPFAGMLLRDDVTWSLADFVAAGALLTIIGVAIELAVRRAGNLALALGLAALGVAAGVFGEADGAPGLVLLGILLVVSGCAIGLRAARA